MGQRSLTDDEDWSPTEDQFVGELGFTTTPTDWAVGIEGSVAYSNDESGDVEGETTEAAVGVRKTFNLSEGRVHPYIGGGLAWIQAEFSGDLGGFDVSDDDSSIAAYAHGGVLFGVSQHVHLGLDVRFLFGSDITLFGEDGDADYLQYGLVLGYSF